MSSEKNSLSIFIPDPGEDPIESFTYEELEDYVLRGIQDQSNPDPTIHEWVLSIMEPNDVVDICYTTYNLNNEGWK